MKCNFNVEEALRRLRFNVKVVRGEQGLGPSSAAAPPWALLTRLPGRFCRWALCLE